MIEDFEGTVSRYITSLRARAAGRREIADYWKGRADEHAFLTGVDRTRAYRAATRLLETATEPQKDADA